MMMISHQFIIKFGRPAVPACGHLLCSANVHKKWRPFGFGTDDVPPSPFTITTSSVSSSLSNVKDQLIHPGGHPLSSAKGSPQKKKSESWDIVPTSAAELGTPIWLKKCIAYFNYTALETYFKHDIYCTI